MLAYANGQSSGGYATLRIGTDGSMWVSIGSQSSNLFLAGLSFHLGS
jgi:hypothetical protein